MSSSTLSQLIQALLHEAIEDEVRTKTKSKTKDWDPFEPQFDQPLTAPEPKVAPGQKSKRAYSRQGPDLGSYAGANASDMLSGEVSPDFDFDTAFEGGLEAEPAAAVVPGGEEHDHQGLEPETPTLRFQPNMPGVIDPPGLEKKQQYARDVTSILMDEFVAPAMSVGQRVLPSVWQEMTRLMRQDHQRFKEQFSSALHQIRDLENHWFSNLLGIEPGPVTMQPAEGPDQEMRERIVEVLEKYYRAVLEVAGENSQNLVVSLQDVASQMSREDFETVFYNALKSTRDIEDQAFAQMM